LATRVLRLSPAAIALRAKRWCISGDTRTMNLPLYSAVRLTLSVYPGVFIRRLATGLNLSCSAHLQGRLDLDCSWERP
jgi:hypothetical protein